MAECKICESKKINTFLRSESFKISICKNCHVAFTSPSPSLPDYENLDFHSKNNINNTDRLTSYSDLPFDWKCLIDLQVELISKYVSKSASILEIGCGEGILLESIRNKGFSNIEGIEPSFTAAARASKRGLLVHNTYFEPSIYNQKYDLVVMSHVLEHIENPIMFLGLINTILNPAGLLLLTQTNYKGLIPFFQRETWYAWVPDQHFWHFTPKNLKIIFQRTGFQSSSLYFSSLVHPHNFLYKAAKLIPSCQDQFILFAKKI